jgi:hypothetical protein
VLRALAIAAVLAACGNSTPGDLHAQSTPTTPTAAAPAAGPAAAVPAPAPDLGAAFRDLADELAARTARRVIAWGEAPLGDDRALRRFAVLEPDDQQDGRGAYLIEAAPDTLWLITFRVDGRTLPWGPMTGESTESDPVWRQRSDRWIDHEQGHHRGGETVHVALRRGRPAVLVYEYTGDADSEVTERRRFARDGVCTEPCPALAGFDTEDAGMEVIGPVATVDALVAGRSRR